MIRKKRMSKGIAKILSGLLVFGMVAGLVPAAPGGTVHAQAANEHSHPVCGSSCTDGNSHDNLEFTELTGSENDLKIGERTIRKTDNNLELPAGNYYLSDSFEPNYSILVKGNVTICLNGHNINMKSAGNVFKVDEGGTLTLTDCKGNSSISHSDVEWGRGVLVSNGTFNMYGGKICNNKCDSSDRTSGAGVTVTAGTFNMHGGEISGNKVSSQGGAVNSQDTFNMYGGSITGNTAQYFGGGVAVCGGTFNMFDGTISGNKVTSAGNSLNGGGGVWVYSGATFCMKGGSITGNTAYPYKNKDNGGGVYCQGSLELSGSPVIEGNKLTTGESNNLVSSNTNITGTLNSDAKIYVYMKDTSTQDQTLATVDPSVSSFDAQNIFYCDNASFVADFDVADNKIKWTAHTHNWGAWTSNGDGTHTRICTSNSSHKQTEKCSGGTATCQSKAVCTTCGGKYGDFASHDFDVSSWGYKGADGHAHVCKTAGCTATDTVIAHIPGPAATEDAAQICTECGYEIVPALNHEHNWGAWTSNGDGTHTHICLSDTSHTESSGCSGGTATCQSKAVCTTCGGEYGDFASHDFDVSSWGYKGADGHAHVCKTAGCTATDTVIAHIPGPVATEDVAQICTECGYEIVPVLNHEHNWGAWTSNGDGTHTRICASNSSHKQTEKCSGGTATDKDKAICSICNTPYGEINAGSNPTPTPEPTPEPNPTPAPNPTPEATTPTPDQAPATSTPAASTTVAPAASAPAQVTYDILDGAGSSWTQNTDGSLAIRGSGEISKFREVKVDGVTVDPVNYTVTEGSTIITFKPEYLKSLPAGNHSFELVWTDGTAATNFTVAENADQSAKSPKTGEDFSMALCTALLMVSCAGLAGIFAKRKRNHAR